MRSQDWFRNHPAARQQQQPGGIQPVARFYSGWETADGQMQQTIGMIGLTTVYINGVPHQRIVTQKTETSVLLPPPEGT